MLPGGAGDNTDAGGTKAPVNMIQTTRHPDSLLLKRGPIKQDLRASGGFLEQTCMSQMTFPGSSHFDIG